MQVLLKPGKEKLVESVFIREKSQFTFIVHGSQDSVNYEGLKREGGNKNRILILKPAPIEGQSAGLSFLPTVEWGPTLSCYCTIDNRRPMG
jgi:hypothetical protein